MDDQQFNIQALVIILRSRLKLDTDRLCAFATNGREALEQVRRSILNDRDGFDLILMDCNMPFVDGYQATSQIRQFLWENNKRQPIISAVTGHTERLYIDQAIASGMN